MPRATVDSMLKEIASGSTQPVYLLTGDLVVAEPAAMRLAEALAERAGCEVESHRHPPSLGTLLADLRTYSLFDSAKVALAIDTAILADRSSAAELIDQAAAVLPLPGREVDNEPLQPAQRQSASRLLQAMRLFGLDPAAGQAGDVVAALPEWVLKGGRALRKKKPRGRSKKDLEALREGLAALLDGAHESGIKGFAEGDLAELGAMVENGLPEGHVLVLAEHTAAQDHPIVEALVAAGAACDLGKVEVGRGGEWIGLEALVKQLEQETGAVMVRDAVAELAQRTLRQTGEFKARKVGTDSTARFAAEYRKLASLAGSGKITSSMVREGVEDRGEEDVWKILEALGQGRGGEALARFRRLVAAADDAMAARLSFFSLLASFCRQLAAVSGVMKVARVPAGVRNYNQFKARWAPELSGAQVRGKNPLAGLHPYRLHRAYLAVSSMPGLDPTRLPWWVLETEMRVKGESSEADAAISDLMARIATAVEQRPRSFR